jgi:CrcB protein
VLSRFLWVCLAGALGSGLRYLLSGWIVRAAGPAFPLGTLVVNLLGSFLLGALMQLAWATDLVPVTLRIALASGLLGGFTTYSSFNYETIRLLEERAWALAALNVAATVLGCLLAGFAGLLLVKRLAG